MVIINTGPWRKDDEKRRFGFKDLESDYYQVLRKRNRPRFCRVLWGITIFVLLGFTSYMVYKLLHDYFQFDSYNKSSTRWERNVTLPAVSICGTNFINYTRLQEELAADNSTRNLLDEFDNLLTELLMFRTEGNILEELNLTRYSGLLDWELEKGSILARFKSDIYDMLIGEYDYTFQGVGYYVENRSKAVNPTDLGTCLELNDNGKMQQSFNGVNGGLTIDLDAKVSDYLFTTPTKGFVIFIRDQDETVMLNQGGYLVSPGTEAFLKLSLKQVTRLGKPHGTCKNVLSPYSKYGKRYESVRECIQRQKLEAIFNTCACIPGYFANRMAALKKWNVLHEVVDKIESLINEENATDPSEDDESGDEDKAEPQPTEGSETDERRRKTVSRNLRDVLIRSKRQEPLLRRSNIHEIPHGRSKREETTDVIATEWAPTTEPIYNPNYSANVCPFSIQKTCDRVVEHFIKSREIEMKGCPEPCSYNEWDVELATTVFPPTEKYFEKFIKPYVSIKPVPDMTYARENMARIHIYYEDMKIDQLTQEKAYEPQNFIAEFGGTVDLLIGLSFFTVFQLIEIGIAACVYMCCTARSKRRGPCPREVLHLLDETELQSTSK